MCAIVAVAPLPSSSSSVDSPSGKERAPAMDEAELTAVYRRYHGLVLRRCRSILRDAHAAEDATQRVFTKLWRHGHSYRLAHSKLAWLYRVAHRCCFDELRRRSRSSSAASFEQQADPSCVL